MLLVTQHPLLGEIKLDFLSPTLNHTVDMNIAVAHLQLTLNLRSSFQHFNQM